MKSLTIIMIATVLFAFNTYAQQRRPMGGEGRGIPEEIKSQLTTEQQQELSAAKNMDERITLLHSWGIKPPARPEGRHRGNKGERRERPAQEELTGTGVAQ